MKSIIKCKPFVLLLGISLILFGFINHSLSPNSVNCEEVITVGNEKGLNSSGFWEIAPFIIDGDESGWDVYQGSDGHNWSWAISQPWCSGLGTWNNPYIIENITINAQYQGSCIRIVDTFKYYVIRNVTVFNSGYDYSDAGIRLEWTENGEIVNSTISFNWNGIIFNDGVHGITISNNDINSNNKNGIFFEYNCNYNNISENTIFYNINGISIFDSQYNSISDNWIVASYYGNQNSYGIYLDHSNYNHIFRNNIEGFSKCIYERSCVENYIHDNPCFSPFTFNPGVVFIIVLIITIILVSAIILVTLLIRSRKSSKDKRARFKISKEEVLLTSPKIDDTMQAAKMGYQKAKEIELDIINQKSECPHCGYILSVKGEFCTNCGRSIFTRPSIAPMKPPEPEIEQIPKTEFPEVIIDSNELKETEKAPIKPPEPEIEQISQPEFPEVIIESNELKETEKTPVKKEERIVKETFREFFCPFCGYLISEKRNFCPQCGTKLKM